MSVPTLPAMRNFGPVTVPQDSYFVMGDNRDMSRDSRYFGFVKSKAIIGRATRVIVSFDKTDWYQPRLKRTLTLLK
jgi:signal peptidase I